jgi:hypothetical protein
MHEHEVRGERAVYDHETEDGHGGRRRAPVADWGVSEELFDRMPTPRRRFSRAGEPVRRDPHGRDRRVELTSAVEVEELQPAAASEPAETVAAREEPASAVPARPITGGVEGRRTIVIGHSDSAVARRPRPSRTVGERMSHRPDRIAAWAVALGLLLIIIAFATAGA